MRSDASKGNNGSNAGSGARGSIRAERVERDAYGYTELRFEWNGVPASIDAESLKPAVVDAGFVKIDLPPAAAAILPRVSIPASDKLGAGSDDQPGYTTDAAVVALAQAFIAAMQRGDLAVGPFVWEGENNM